MDISKLQISAAMALLDMTQAELAEGTQLSKPTISNFLKSSTGWETKESTQKRIINFLRSRGIEFTEDEGVKKSPFINILTGRDGFRLFMDDVYEVAKTIGGEICIYNARPSNWTTWLGSEWFDQHAIRMEEALKKKPFNFRITAQRGDTNFIARKYAEYRWVSDELFSQQSVYLYGDSLALMSFDEDDVEIFVLRKKEFADSFRAMFNHVWKTTTETPH